MIIYSDELLDIVLSDTPPVDKPLLRELMNNDPFTA